MQRRSTLNTVLIIGAFALGAAATAGAATLITGKQIKDGTVASADLKNNSVASVDVKDGSLALKDFSTAAKTGLKGDKGDSGLPGAPGSSGSAAPALLIGAGGGVNPGATSFHSVTGGNFGSIASSQSPVPPGTTLTARDFIASTSVAPGVGQSVTVTFLIDGAPTALSCVIAGTATSCQPASTATVVLVAGTKMSMQNTATAGVPVVGNTVGWAIRVVF